jgi:sec-independent protein translocase protein TatA
VVVLAVLFGGSQIPKLAHSLGSARREFKKGLDDGAADPDAGLVAAPRVDPPVWADGEGTGVAL